MKVHELSACPVCGGTHSVTFDLGGGNLLQRCTECRTVAALDYADPSEVYVDGYMFGEAGEFGLDVRRPAFQDLLVRIAHQRIGMIEAATGIINGSLLDVGSGTGEVLRAARDRGWTTQGVEPERTAADLARSRGLDVRIAHLEESGLPERTYDVVTAFHVLEHVPDARAFLETIQEWARPGGYVTIEVPNFNSVERRRLGERWKHLRPREHVVHFTPDTLQRAFRIVGLEPVLVRSPLYVGPPQSVDHALSELVRHGPLSALIRMATREGELDGKPVRVPTRLGWAALHGVEWVYDRAGVGAVVFCVGRVP